MEILSHLLEGAVRHEDSMGSSEILRPGELQHMSVGSGVPAFRDESSVHHAGSVEVAAGTLKAGDGLHIADETTIEVSSVADGEFLLFDLK